MGDKSYIFQEKLSNPITLMRLLINLMAADMLFTSHMVPLEKTRTAFGNDPRLCFQI